MYEGEEEEEEKEEEEEVEKEEEEDGDLNNNSTFDFILLPPSTQLAHYEANADVMVSVMSCQVVGIRPEVGGGAVNWRVKARNCSGRNVTTTNTITTTTTTTKEGGVVGPPETQCTSPPPPPHVAPSHDASITAPDSAIKVFLPPHIVSSPSTNSPATYTDVHCDKRCVHTLSSLVESTPPHRLDTSMQKILTAVPPSLQAEAMFELLLIGCSRKE
ncbi:hypothetical protein TSMEX_008593 [Taenia solium]|eukprot:TsM_000132600 transcript=TsM_000132600 gene=TsM_000132600